MISFDFEYYKPDSIYEAVNLYENMNSRGKRPLYYAGGTEIITFARRNHVFTKAVIDIKGILECTAFQVQNHQVILGSALSLSQLTDSKSFPLVSKTAGFAADRTSRNKITLGGNICGRIIYHEAVLPFLLFDSRVVIAGKDSKRLVPINEIFQKKIQLQKGELLVQLITDARYADLPHFTVKKTRQGTPDYPLLSLAAIKIDNRLRIAFSGVCAFPFRSLEMEEAINDRRVPPESRIKRAISLLPAPIMNNIQGSAEYRGFVLKNTLWDVLEALEGG